MNLLRDQVAVGILELLNIQYNLESEKIPIDRDTNIYKKFELDELDSQFLAWDFNVLFDIHIPESEEESFLNTPFNSLVDYICNLGATISTSTREPVYCNDLLMNAPDTLKHIDAVLSGRRDPKYTLNPYYNCDKSEWRTRFQKILEYQQEQRKQAQREKMARDAAELKEWYAFVDQKYKEEARKRRIIIAIAIAFIIGVSVAGHYVVKKRKQNPKQISELFQQTKK